MNFKCPKCESEFFSVSLRYVGRISGEEKEFLVLQDKENPIIPTTAFCVSCRSVVYCSDRTTNHWMGSKCVEKEQKIFEKLKKLDMKELDRILTSIKKEN